MTIYSGFSHWTWWFSTATLNYQRVFWFKSKHARWLRKPFAPVSRASMASVSWIKRFRWSTSLVASWDQGGELLPELGISEADCKQVMILLLRVCVLYDHYHYCHWCYYYIYIYKYTYIINYICTLYKYFVCVFAQYGEMFRRRRFTRVGAGAYTCWTPKWNQTCQTQWFEFFCPFSSQSW